MQQITSTHPIICILDETLRGSRPIDPGHHEFALKCREVLSRWGTIVLKSLREQDAVLISIQDQEIGIPEEAQNTIFVPIIPRIA